MKRLIFLLELAALVTGSFLAHAGDPGPAPPKPPPPKELVKPAKISVSGFGLLGNREMTRLLKNFQAKRPTIMDRTFVEDAVLVLLSRPMQEGYLQPRLTARFVMEDGSRQNYAWTNVLEAQLPRDFAAREARFRIRPGPRSYYRSLRIVGANAISPGKARKFFIAGEGLLVLRGNKAFSPDRIQAALAAYREALMRKGYRQASVSATEIRQDKSSGAVDVTIQVEEGLPSVAKGVRVEIIHPDGTVLRPDIVLPPDKPYSPLWEQDFSRHLQEQQYARGYPDTTVQLSIVGRATNAMRIELNLLARLYTGSWTKIGAVRLTGTKRTRPAVLESRVTLKEGEALDRLQAEKARQRLARLGVFDWVQLRYEQTEEDVRDVIYELKESKAIQVGLLGGYGSYELLRGGVELEHRNVFGLAHAARLRAMQSFKATSGELVYTVPEFRFENLDLFARGAGLHREELTFTREEYGGGAGFHKRLQPLRSDFSIRYDYEFLNALNAPNSLSNTVGVTKARAAAIVLELTRDGRDNPLLPRHGLKVSGTLELASAGLGGNVDYQRLLLTGSYHQDLGGGLLLHLGLTHGLTLTLGGEDTELPFNKRFFPGGENAVRGYQQGEASPLDAQGHQLGAETFTQGNFELEHLITRGWSVVGFLDAVGFAQERANYPWDETLFSAGGGIRWRTLIGPVRLEYGHNLNPRPHDPSGTLHLSIGFPF